MISTPRKKQVSFKMANSVSFALSRLNYLFNCFSSQTYSAMFRSNLLLLKIIEVSILRALSILGTSTLLSKDFVKFLLLCNCVYVLLTYFNFQHFDIQFSQPFYKNSFCLLYTSLNKRFRLNWSECSQAHLTFISKSLWPFLIHLLLFIFGCHILETRFICDRGWLSSTFSYI